MNKKRAAEELYNGYSLPASAEKGVPFIDFNTVLKRVIPRKVKIVKKRK